MAKALSIERAQRIAVSSDGATSYEHRIFVKVFLEFMTSGLMAELGGNPTLTLLALALRARVLADPQYPGAEEEFQELARLGIVSETDRGKLFCFVSQDRIAEDTGLVRNTVKACIDRLSDLGLVQRLSDEQIHLARGRFGSNTYFIHPDSSHVSKFDTTPTDRAQNLSTVETRVSKFDTPPTDRAQNLSTVDIGHRAQNLSAAAPTVRKFYPLKRNNKEQKEEEQKELDIIARHFADCIGVQRYEPNEKEERKIATLLTEGYSVEQVCAGITCAVQRAAARGQQVRTIAYCIPVVRETAVSAVQGTEVGSPNPKAVSGQPLAESEPNRGRQSPSAPSLEELAGGDAELHDLLEIVQERNPDRVLRKSDVRAWQAVAERFRELAAARSTTPIGVVMQAVLAGIGANSDRDGYFSASLAETILKDWQRLAESQRAEVHRAQDSHSGNGQPLYARINPPAAGTLPPFQAVDGLLDPVQLWTTALQELCGQMTKATFDTWVKPTFVVDARDGSEPMLVIGTHNPYAVEWLGRRLHTTIERTVAGIVGKTVAVQYRYVGVGDGAN